MERRIHALPGIGWASGINLYAAICMLGILAALSRFPDLLIPQDPLSSPPVSCNGGVRADKTLGVDTGDVLVPSSAFLPAPCWRQHGACARRRAGRRHRGGTLATAHATKVERALINTSPEPFSK
jgi:hypothetical protein